MTSPASPAQPAQRKPTGDCRVQARRVVVGQRWIGTRQMRRSEFRWTPGGLVQIPVVFPNWETSSTQVWRRRGSDETWAGGRGQRNCNGLCACMQKKLSAWLLHKDRTPSIHPSTFPTVHCQTVQFPASTGPGQTKRVPSGGLSQAGQSCGSFLSCLQRHYSKGKNCCSSGSRSCCLCSLGGGPQYTVYAGCRLQWLPCERTDSN